PERLRAAMNQARKQRDQGRTLLLSTILADLKNREFELQHPVSDEEAAEVVRRGIKRRREAAEQYTAAGRADRAEAELAEVTALAQVAELAALLLADDAVRAEPGPDITAALEPLGVPGSGLEGAALARLGGALAAARIVAGDLARLAAAAPRTAALRVAPPPKELEQRLAVSLDADGQVQDGASRTLARARRAVREARARLVKQLDAMLAALDPTDRAPDAAVTVREGRYVIPVRSTARARIGGIVHDESATRATVFIEPPEVIELGNALRAAEPEEQREVLQVLRDLTELLRPHRDAIAAAWEMCVAFDDLCARARYAVEVNGFAPAIGPGPLEIRNGRHPLLVGGEVVVPFDLVLSLVELCIL